MSHSKILPLAETAIVAALAFVISLIPNTIYGWVIIEIACIPVLLFSFRRGALFGSTAGLIWGILSLITGHAWILTPIQAFLEYIIAPICLGLAGFFQQKAKSVKLFSLSLGIILAVLVKYFMHFIAGILFWSSVDKAWAGWVYPLYSLAVNGISGLLTAIAAVIIIFVIVKKVPKVLL